MTVEVARKCQWSESRKVMQEGAEVEKERRACHVAIS